MTNYESWDKLSAKGYVQFIEVQNVDTQNLPMDIVFMDGKYYRCVYTVAPENIKLLLQIEQTRTIQKLYGAFLLFALPVFLFMVVLIFYILSKLLV